MRRIILVTLSLMLAFVFGISLAKPVFAEEMKEEMKMKGKEMMEPASTTKVAALRVALNSLFREHVFLAAAATDAALGGRDAEFKAAAAALDARRPWLRRWLRRNPIA